MLRYLTFFVLFISTVAICPPKSVFRHLKCYKFHSELSSFDVANLSCSILKGHLAIVNDKEDNDFLTQESKKHFGNESDAWIGERAPQQEKYSNFNDQSLPFADRYCVSLQLEDGYWKVNHCLKSIRKPYICEYELPINTVAPPSGDSKKVGVTGSVTQSNPVTVIPKQKECPSEWHHFNGFCYHSTAPTRFEWQDAENYCLSQNSHLVSIHSDLEFKFVDGLDKEHQCFWTGLNATDDSKKVWKYSDGTQFDYIKFSTPKQREFDARYGQCVYSCNQWLSNANQCTAKLYAICKKPVVA